MRSSLPTPSRRAVLALCALVLVARVSSAQSGRSAFEAGKAALAGGNADSAAVAFTAAVKQNEGSAEYHFWLGQAYARQSESGNMLAKARAASRMKSEWERAVELDATHYEAHRGLYEFAAGAPAIMGGGEERMARERAAMLKLRPYAAGVYFARVDQRRGHVAEAMAALRPLVAAYPDSVAAYQVLVTALEDAHDVAAWAVLDSARARFGPTPALDFLLGRGAAIFDTRTAEGSAALQRLTVLSPSVAAAAFPAGAAHYRLGMIEEHAGRVAEARRYYEQAIALDAKNATFRSAVEHLSKR